MRLPGLLLFLIFFPLQVYLAIKLYASYGFWTTFLFLLVEGACATRAARAHWIRMLLFPHSAMRHEGRRHVFQGILFLGAALSWFFVASPQPWFPAGIEAWLRAGYPWVPISLAASLVKSALR